MAKLSINSVSAFYLGQLGYAYGVRLINQATPKQQPRQLDNDAPDRQEFDVVGISEHTGAQLFDSLFLTMPPHKRMSGEIVDEETLEFVDINIRVAPDVNISKTQLSAQKGTFKVLTGFGDHRIYCDGTFTTQDRTLPLKLVSTLEKLRLSEVRLNAISRLLNEGYDVQNCIIDGSVQVTQVRGSANTYEFSFEMVSDYDFDIVIK